MLTIGNEELVVEIVDPRSDGQYLGTRYCTGGYIFQVTDAAHGPLLAGPTYPGSFNVIDGQGIPDSFNLAPLKGVGSSDLALVLGIGLCDLGDNTISQPCVWRIDQNERSVGFATQHVFECWTIEVERRVTLEGRTVRSQTVVRNSGAERFSIVWFPHPFFPQLPTGNDELIKLNLELSVPENESYALAPNGYIWRKGWQWTAGHYQALTFSRARELVIIQRHPTLGQISASCDFVPTYFPIWGNENTFSWEPMIERTIAPGQEARWQIDYDF